MASYITGSNVRSTESALHEICMYGQLVRIGMGGHEARGGGNLAASSNLDPNEFVSTPRATHRVSAVRSPTRARESLGPRQHRGHTSGSSTHSHRVLVAPTTPTKPPNPRGTEAWRVRWPRPPCSGCELTSTTTPTSTRRTALLRSASPTPRSLATLHPAEEARAPAPAPSYSRSDCSPSRLTLRHATPLRATAVHPGLSGDTELHQPALRLSTKR